MKFARRLGPELLAIIEDAAHYVRPDWRDVFLSDVQDRLRPLDQPDYAHVRAAVQAALSRLRDDDD
jgi:hypothetical protein